jgi:hypothetical protein
LFDLFTLQTNTQLSEQHYPFTHGFSRQGKQVRLFVAAMLLVHGSAMAQTFACQYTTSAGLKWENGRWRNVIFVNPPPFFLKIEGDRLTADSVAKAISGLNFEIRCERDRFNNTFSCFDQSGGFLYFSPQRSAGGVSQMLGASSERSDYRDSVSVAAFTCQQM